MRTGKLSKSREELKREVHLTRPPRLTTERHKDMVKAVRKESKQTRMMRVL